MQIGANDITLEVEDHGPTSGEPLLLVMGLGMQLTGWPVGFVRKLVAQGFRVIRFDNRDAGLSQGFDQLGAPNVALAGMQYTMRMNVRSAYSLADMARDAVGVLDALGIKKAHVCGASMGGMIAQHMALEHADRIKSLTLMMTTSGGRSLPQPSLKSRAAMLSRPADPRQFDSLVDHGVKLFRLFGSPAYPAPDAELRERVAASIKRASRPKGVARQLCAVLADGSRAERLHAIKAPTLVIHGDADPLVPPAGGQDLALRIPGARLDLIPGMGHDLPEPLWPRFVDGIKALAQRAP